MRILIKTLKQKGFMFGIATGRSLTSCLNDIPDLKELCDVIICNNGGYVYDCIDDVQENLYMLPVEIAHEIADLYKAGGFTPCLFHEAYFVAEAESTFTNTISKKIPFKLVADIKDEIQDEIYKLVFVIDNDDEMRAIKAYESKHKSSLYHGFQAQRDLYELMDPRINKAVGIQWFLNRHNLKLEEVMAFGDNDNDIQMIHQAGVGVAVKNATEPVKDVADYVADSNVNDGVYHFIMSYLTS